MPSSICGVTIANIPNQCSAFFTNFYMALYSGDKHQSLIVIEIS
jgi:hypothetical protein